MIPRRYRELWSQQMAEISRQRKRELEEGRDTAIRRLQDRERQSQDMWPEESAQEKALREELEEQLKSASGARVEV